MLLSIKRAPQTRLSNTHITGDEMKQRFIYPVILFLLVLMAGCSSHQVIDVEPQPLISASEEISDKQLLDVGIVIFDPGLEEEYDEDDLIMPEVRKAEARFIPVHLRNTLQQSGHWGAVRVLPEAVQSLDLIVNGAIIESDGEVLSLHITAVDATGKQWLDNVYNSELTDAKAYQGNLRGKKDAFQDLYNAIANDLLLIRKQQSAKQIENIHRVAMLRFTEKILPDAFSGYVVEDDNQQLQAIRMPAANDPMFSRVQRIHGRDAMLIDTIDGYYDHYYSEMWDSYEAWRNGHREEVIAYRELESAARKRYALGALAIAGAIGLAVAGVDGTGLIQAAMIGGGAYVIKTGYDKSQEAQINADAIKELDESFDLEVQPQVIDIDGRTVELTGSAKAQFQTWRKMMHDLYITETGFESPQADAITATPTAPQ